MPEKTSRRRAACCPKSITGTSSREEKNNQKVQPAMKCKSMHRSMCKKSTRHITWGADCVPSIQATNTVIGRLTYPRHKRRSKSTAWKLKPSQKNSKQRSQTLEKTKTGVLCRRVSSTACNSARTVRIALRVRSRLQGWQLSNPGIALISSWEFVYHTKPSSQVKCLTRVSKLRFKHLG